MHDVDIAMAGVEVRLPGLGAGRAEDMTMECMVLALQGPDGSGMT